MRIIGLGAGGHAKVLIEIIRFNASCQLIGLLDSKLELHGKNVMDVPVLGGDDLLPHIVRDGTKGFFIGLGSIGDTRPRKRLFEMAMEHGLKPVDTIHPQTIISPSADLGQGITVMAGAVINACAHLGMNVIVNTGAIIEHDCIIEDHVHVASGSRLASTVRVGEGAHIGAGATVLQCIRIGKNVLVGAGAVVIRDVPDGVTVVGCPAQVLNRKD